MGQRPMWRSRKSILWTVALVTVCYLIFFTGRSPQALPPLPGTYQYFTEINVENQEPKRFGAISHHDPRFMPQLEPTVKETRFALVALLKTYMATMKDLHIDTWIAHGTLLGWWWNQKMLPWDTDVDVQISVESMIFLASSHNMTEYTLNVSDAGSPRTYLLDINPHHSISSTRDVANKIDARWIDKSTGKYIDITVVHPDLEREAKGHPNALFCKDGHRYEEHDIFPLQPTLLEGIDVSVPYNTQKVLKAEYGRRSLTNGRFHWYRFNKAKKEWIPE